MEDPTKVTLEVKYEGKSFGEMMGLDEARAKQIGRALHEVRVKNLMFNERVQTMKAIQALWNEMPDTTQQEKVSFTIILGMYLQIIENKDNPFQLMGSIMRQIEELERGDDK